MTPLIHIEIIYIENANIKNNLHAPTDERAACRRRTFAGTPTAVPDLFGPQRLSFARPVTYKNRVLTGRIIFDIIIKTIIIIVLFVNERGVRHESNQVQPSEGVY